MVTASKLLPLAATVVLLIGLGLKSADSTTHQEVTHEAEAQFEAARARALLVAFLCYCYETDNGKFPASISELYWPINYAANSSRIYGFDFEASNKDPLWQDEGFLIKPVVKSLNPNSPGIRFKGGSVEGWVISASGSGERLIEYEVLFLDRLPSRRRSFLEPYDPELDGESVLLFITDDQIRRFATSPDFDLERLIREAALE